MLHGRIIVTMHMLVAIATYHTSSSTAKDNAAGADDSRTDLWLLGLFPFNGSWPGGLGQLPAVKMGLADVNNNPNVLPGYRLRMTEDNTQCDAGVGTNAMYRRLYSAPTKLLVLGAGCSDVSQATAQASHLWNLIQLSYSSASPALSKKEKYKRFYRVFPPESSFNPAKFELLDTFNWKKVGTLSQTKQLFSMTMQRFLNHASERGIKVLSSESFTNDPRQQVQNLEKNGARIIIGNFYENMARLVFCEAYKKKMYGAKYVWIITGFYSRHWWKQVDSDHPHDCTISQLEQAIKGYFTTDALPLSLRDSPGVSGQTTDQFHARYTKLTNGSRSTGYQEAPYGYDSVWAVALMLNNSITTLQQQGLTAKLSSFSYTNDKMAQIFLHHMNATSFEGVSGPVMFDGNGDRQGLTQIEQLQDGEEVRVGVYDHRHGAITWEPRQPVRWIDGDPPPDSITERVVPIVISFELFLTMTILAALGIVLSILFLVFNIRYRRRRYIKMSSPNLNNVILLGAVLSYISIIFAGIDGNMVTIAGQLVMCKFYTWTIALGFSFSFGAMFSKTWRVHKIFTNKKIQRMVIKDYQLLVIVFVLVGMDVLCISLWEFIDPLNITPYNRTSKQMPDPNNDNQVLIPQSRYCESPKMWYFAGALYAIKGLLLVFGAFLAFETRKVSVPALNDSKFIGISVYNVVVLCLLGVPISLVMKEQLDAAYTLISLFIFFATTLTICLVFIPKIINRNLEPHTGPMWTKSHESTAANKRQPSSNHVRSRGDSCSLRLREENSDLKQALEMAQNQLREVQLAQTTTTTEVNGLASPVTVSEGLPTQLVASQSEETIDNLSNDEHLTDDENVQQGLFQTATV